MIANDTHTPSKEEIMDKLAFIRAAQEHGTMEAEKAKRLLGQTLFRGVMMGMSKFELYPHIYTDDASGQDAHKNSL